MTAQAQRVKRAIGLVGGAICLLFAGTLPLWIPSYQQLEILIVAFWFAALGALLLNNTGAYDSGKRQLLRAAAGVAIATFGLAMPWLRGADADSRFFWMIALGPIAICGVAMALAALNIAPPAQQKSATAAISPRRAPVERVPNTGAFRWLLPAVLAMMALAVLVVLITVVVPAIAVFLR